MALLVHCVSLVILGFTCIRRSETNFLTYAINRHSPVQSSDFASPYSTGHVRGRQSWRLGKVRRDNTYPYRRQQGSEAFLENLPDEARTGKASLDLSDGDAGENIGNIESTSDEQVGKSSTDLPDGDAENITNTASEILLPSFPALSDTGWNYRQRGKDWGGTCKTGLMQSPVDLHIEGLEEREFKNLTSLYKNVFSGATPPARMSRPWKKGDIFYIYPNLFSRLQVYKTENVFQVSAPTTEMVSLGALFPTETAEMFLAQHIFFHSPSEHTFQGEANRREIEMQIWHYSNDPTSHEVSQGLTNTSLPYLALFAENSLDMPAIKRVEKTSSAEEPASSDSSFPHWSVISITFRSEDLDQASKEDLDTLPSQRLLNALLVAEKINSTVGGRPESISLERAMNLQALMMMLQLSNTEFFAYHGSMTMPKCQENVQWYVARQPLPVATETMLRFYKMLNPKRLSGVEEKDGNFRMLQNVEGNMHNEGNLFLVQGYPLQLLIASSLGFRAMAQLPESRQHLAKEWFGSQSLRTTSKGSTIKIPAWFTWLLFPGIAGFFFSC